jgi:hypothetical protein
MMPREVVVRPLLPRGQRFLSPITNPFLVLHTVHLLENTPSSPVGELAQLESTLNNVLEMLDRVLVYAQEAAAGKPADAALGRYLMGALGGGAEESGKGGGFTSSLQVRPVAQVRDEIICANIDALCYS